MVSHVFWPSCCQRHVQYPVAVVACTRVLLYNCLLEAPGAFSIATYTPRWCVFDGPLVASVYLCAPPRCRLSFVGIIFVFGPPPVTLDSLTFIFGGALRFLLILPCFSRCLGMCGVLRLNYSVSSYSIVLFIQLFLLFTNAIFLFLCFLYSSFF